MGQCLAASMLLLYYVIIKVTIKVTWFKSTSEPIRDTSVGIRLDIKKEEEESELPAVIFCSIFQHIQQSQ